MRFRRILTVVSVLAFYGTMLFAKPVLPDQAFETAHLFFRNRHESGMAVSKKRVAARVAVLRSNQLASSGKEPYYIYNYGENDGFVIVSGDDRTKPILGYSDQGAFPTGQLPSNLEYLLESYRNAIDSLAEIPEISSSNSEQTDVASAGTPVVSPLLGDIQWGQDVPFNLFCPYDNTEGMRTYVGCVATAMAMIMKYYNWPSIGIGSSSYVDDNYGKLSANYGATTYNWSSMKDSYLDGSTGSQDSAVAQLMYHCGIAVEMSYSPYGSGAHADMAAKALKTYFGYDTDLQLFSRDFYNQSEWVSMINKELNDFRPVLYCASTVSEGHAFVCDGYDSNGFYHINWGWSGYCNGYFELISLSNYYPEITGATGGFLLNHTLISGIQKPDGVSKSSYQMGMLSSMTSTQKSSTTASIGFNIYNSGANTFNGKVGLGYIKSGENTLNILNEYPYTFKLSPQVYTSLLKIDLQYSAFPANSICYLYEVYKSGDSTSWSIVRGTTQWKNHLIVSRNGNSTTITSPVYATDLVLADSIGVEPVIYRGRNTSINLTLKNQGVEYNSYIGLYLYSETDSLQNQYLVKTPVTSLPGETLTYHVSGVPDLPNGVYLLKALYDPTNSLISQNLQLISSSWSNPVRVRIASEIATNLSTAENNSVKVTFEGKNLKVETDTKVISLYLYNSNGQVVKHATDNDILSIGDLPAGVYIVRVETINGLTIRKIVLI
jgi:hypothetical protein